MARVAGAQKISRPLLTMGRRLGLIVFLTVLLAPLVARAAAVRLSVAASMTDAVKELVRAFSAANPAIKVLPNFASSGSLAKQITQGAPADLYISANQRWMAYLIQKEGVAPHTVQVLAYNGLVFVGRGQKKLSSLNDILSLSRLAIGSPKSVPAGQYAAQVMRAAGIYDQLARDHKLVMAKDVRQALIYAERGEVDGAFVYRTDAQLAREASVLLSVPAELHDPIAYPLGLTKSGVKNRAAQAFYDFLLSPAAVKILAGYGFAAAPRPEPEGAPK